jgi:apolipoprotein N-acyltransferase
MNRKQITYPLQDRWSYLWLVIATLLSIFSQTSGKWLIPILAWVCPIFFLRFFRTHRRAWLAYLWLAVSTAIVTFINLPPMLGSMGPPIAVVVSLLIPLPYLADRWLTPRLRGFAGTLVFPLAMTAFAFISAVTSPFGSSSALPYSQFDNLPLLQLVSLTGMWGLAFLINWLGSVVNWAWEREFAWAEIKRGTLVFLSLLLLVMVYGEARLWFAPTPAQTVRVAGFTMVEWRVNHPAMMQAFQTDLEAFHQMMEERYQLYFDATIKEAHAGARLISWPENAMTVTPEDEPALVARLGELAKQESIYLVAPIVEMVLEAPYANKLVIFDPQGQVVLEHYKYGGPGMEGNRLNGDRILHAVQTPYGVISAIICWDTVLQGVVTQAGRNGTDILFTPSLTYPETDPMFAQNSVMRGIENGVSTIHVSDMGFSVIADPYGRILASMDHYPAGERALVAQVPTKGAWTLYPIVGDLFGWLSVIGMVGLVIFGTFQSLRSRKAKAANAITQAQVE